mmetsp:Transcript_6269/g.15523  ORF Transcript_6269/g.15523 Transcript_6269/m.15523 type:complete len:259 (-) Transcript_6269:27-803(-)
MDHESKGVSTEEDRSNSCKIRRVTFKSESDNTKYIQGNVDQKTDVQHAIKNEQSSRQEKTSSVCTPSCDEKLGNPERKKSTEKLTGILRPRTISLSPLPFQTAVQTAPCFSLPKISKAMKRSSETMGYIEKLGKRIFHRPEHKQLEPQQRPLESSFSHLQSDVKINEIEFSSSEQQKRRTVSLENTKVMMGQSLPLTMMPFVEEALKAAYFFRRRRKENEHGRIIHKILIEQHERVMKELVRDQQRNGDTNHSSRQEL